MQLRAAHSLLATIVFCLVLGSTSFADDSGSLGVSPTGPIGPNSKQAVGSPDGEPTSVTTTAPQQPPMPAYVATPAPAPATGAVATPPVPTPAATAAPRASYPAPPPPGWVGTTYPTSTHTTTVPSAGAYFPSDEGQPDAPPAAEPPAEIVIEEAPADMPPVVEQPLAPPPPPGTPSVRAVGPPPSAWTNAGTLQRTPTVLGQDPCVPACGQRRDSCCWPIDKCGRRYGCWEVTLVGTVGWLNDPDGVLGTEAFGFPNQFDWDQMINYDVAPGVRGGVKYALRPQEWLEVRGGWLGKWDGSGSQVGVFGFQPANSFVGGGHQRDGVSNDVFGTASSEAELYGAEINYISEISCSGCFRWDLILGIRAMRFDETSRMDFANAPITGFTGPSFVNSDVENTFIGAQVGTTWHYDVNDCFDFTATLKVMAGNLRRKATVSDQSIFAGGPHTATGEEDEIVLGGDLELMARWRVLRCLSIVGGYNLLILDGVLRAPDAMDFSNSFSGAVQVKQDTNQMIYHGFFAGVQLNF